MAPYLPFSALLRLSGVRVFMPFYHLVSDNPPPHVKHLYPICNTSEFSAQLQFMLKHFTPIGASELVRIVQTGTRGRKPYLFLSFDDGFSELYSVVAPILMRHSVPATFFVNTGFVDNRELFYRCKVSLIANAILCNPSLQSVYNVNSLLKLGYTDATSLTDIANHVDVDFDTYLATQKPYLELSQLKTLASQGFTIGGHSATHPNFSTLTPEQQLAEVTQCMSWVNTYFPNQPQLFSFPFSDIGVEAPLFSHLQNQPNTRIDLAFGTSGIKRGKHPMHFQRIPMEYSYKSAKKILGGELFYYLVKRFLYLG
ncbi:MAG: polysaccharide deacetylase family protein [Bacteroidales bacterium]|nr:polysaccharide deacetylase family protein [Bacteroidales bacterium]